MAPPCGQNISGDVFVHKGILVDQEKSYRPSFSKMRASRKFPEKQSLYTQQGNIYPIKIGLKKPFKVK
jgi:hypothetical protein